MEMLWKVSLHFPCFSLSLCTSQLHNYTSPDHGRFSEVIPFSGYPKHQRAASVKAEIAKASTFPTEAPL